MFNNRVALNDGNELQILHLQTVKLVAYHFPPLSETPALSVGNLNFANPKFADILSNNFRLVFTSLMRNPGTGGFDADELDYDQNLRSNDRQVDIGASENRELFWKNRNADVMAACFLQTRSQRTTIGLPAQQLLRRLA